MRIYRAKVDTPFGMMRIAVLSTEYDAKQDIMSAAHSEIPAPYGMMRIKGEVKRSNRRILNNMYPIKNAKVYKDDRFHYWAWIAKE